MNTEAKPATKVKVLIDATVEADMRLYRPHWQDNEEYAKALERECKDFMEHCQDHRSLDHIRLSVNRLYEDQCSACGGRWEPVNDPEMNEGRTSCACCGVEISK